MMAVTEADAAQVRIEVAMVRVREWLDVASHRSSFTGAQVVDLLLDLRQDLTG